MKPENDDIRDDVHTDEKVAAAQEAPKHVHRRKWWKVTLKTLVWVLIVILMLPVLVYIPPVQTFLKDVACKVIKSSTGMDVSIDRFRLKFPLDVELDGVSVVQANGDTMVSARSLVADVKLLPLLKLDVQVNKVDLNDGYFRMVSADSSMIMAIRASRLGIADGTNVDIKKSRIILDKAELQGGDVSLFMDVWKKKSTPEDTTSTPFYIQVNDLKVKDIRFAMSMRPTIDTLTLDAGDLLLKNGVIDLEKNKIKLKYASVGNGGITYLSPDKAYVEAHPAPVDTVKSDSPPMVIEGDSIRLYNFAALYGVQGAKPQPGFDPSYIQATDINIDLVGLYNESSTVRLPIKSLSLKERSGLDVTSGHGFVGVDSIGLDISDFYLTTPFSRIQASANVPFALMDMNPDAAMSANVDASVGMQDVLNFMPSLSTYTKMLPGGSKLNAKLITDGSLSALKINTLDLNIPKVLSVQAAGYANNVLDFKRLDASIKLKGSLMAPKVIDKLAGGTGIDIPTFTISGTAGAHNKAYNADIALHTSAGDLAAKGNINLNSEVYNANVNIRDINIGQFVPDMGLGRVTAHINAKGRGFNPTKPGAHTVADIDVAHLGYRGHDYRNINLTADLADHNYIVRLASGDPDADLDLDARGSLYPGLYNIDLRGRINRLDLQALGFSETPNAGSAVLSVVGTAQPENWLYDVDLSLDNLDWDMADNYIHLPAGVHARLLARENDVLATVDSDLTSLNFTSEANLEDIIDRFSKAAEMALSQVDARNLDVMEIQKELPPFVMDFNASGRGLINKIISPETLSLDTVYAKISNKDLFSGNVGVRNISISSMRLDTITLDLSQRASMIDYNLHMGNAPGTLDEFAKVDARGYIGGNRLSLSLNQKNIQGETGYRLGLTAAMQDSTISVHFTPLKATIAYLPWTFNADNYIDYRLDNKLEANLLAKSSESSILLQSSPNPDGGTDLHAKLDNIKVQDFLRLAITAPPIAATVNTDINLLYRGSAITGNGTLDVLGLSYDNQRIGDFNFLFDAGLDFEGDTEASASLLVNGEKALTAYGKILNKPEEGESKNRFGLTLTQFPLAVANSFLPKDMAQLKGAINGNLEMTGEFTEPQLNGHISFDSAAVYLPIAASSLRLDTTEIVVKENVVDFNNFRIYAQNDNPLIINGYVDAKKFSNIKMDMAINGTNVALLNNDKRSGADLYGKVDVSLNASAKGPLSRLDINANLNLLNSTNVFYQVVMAQSSSISTVNSASDVVKFVQFSDSTQVAKADSVTSSLNMRINAGVNIAAGTQVTVLLSTNGTDRVELAPSGSLNYFQNFMGDMKLNGQLNLGEGFARYAIPVIGEKKFVFEPNSYVSWSGELLNPMLHINCYDDVRAAVNTGNGNSRTINFKVSLAVSDHLSQPKVQFDLSTNEDITIANELQSMTPDQRSNQAMNLLVTGMYTGSSTGTAKTQFNGAGTLYSFLTSQINSWAANNIRGVDLTFGVDQNENTVDGHSTTSTSYTYQVSKSLFNNKFKIVVGGNYSTDATADENFAQNLLSNVSFEYMLRQSNTLSMYLSLFRHTGFESVLEGEVTEMGVGFVMRRRLDNLRQLFSFLRPHHKPKPETDSVTFTTTPATPAEPSDSVTIKDARP